MGIGNLKRRYLDLRLGGVTVNPIIQASNFVMLSYTIIIMTFNIPFWVYAPLFLIGVVSVFTIIGLLFRKIQLSTDEDLKYEKQKELNKTQFEIMKQLKKLSDAANIPVDNSFLDRMETVKKISEI